MTHTHTPSIHHRPGRFMLAACALILLLSLAQSAAQAARLWILPSQTVLSPSNPWVSFEAASSNNLFNPNGSPLGVESISATGPDGQPLPLTNTLDGHLRSSFDLELKEPGTYRIELRPGFGLPANFMPPNLFGTYNGEEGQLLRWFGTAETIHSDGVAEKPGFMLREWGRRRVVTFVTLGAPTQTVLAPDGYDLELDYEQAHPNDLYASEPATFRILLDGKPCSDATLTVVREGDRYRDSEDALVLEPDSDGLVTVNWPQSGRYWLRAMARVYGINHGVPSGKMHLYTVVLEVL